MAKVFNQGSSFIKKKELFKIYSTPTLRDCGLGQDS
jgi:hypothetical protein